MLVNPISFRLSICTFWRSVWTIYDLKNYKHLMFTDILFFEYFNWFCKHFFVNTVGSSLLSHIRFYRTNKKFIINIYYYHSEYTVFEKRIRLNAKKIIKKKNKRKIKKRKKKKLKKIGKSNITWKDIIILKNKRKKEIKEKKIKSLIQGLKKFLKRKKKNKFIKIYKVKKIIKLLIKLVKRKKKKINIRKKRKIVKSRNLLKRFNKLRYFKTALKLNPFLKKEIIKLYWRKKKK